MNNVYEMLKSKDKEMRNLGKATFAALSEKEFDDLVAHHLTVPYTNRLPKEVRAKIASRIVNMK